MKLALAMGDPAGIGPEIVIRSLMSEVVQDLCEPIIYGDPIVYQRAAAVCGTTIDISRYLGRCQGDGPLVDADDSERSWATHSKWAGQVQVASLKEAFKAAQRGEVNGVVFAPFNKHSLALAGIEGDETVVMRSFFKVPEVRTVTRWRSLLRSTVVGHVPFVQIRDNITDASISSAITRLVGMCQTFGIRDPRIGIAGLNPHSGDRGTLGDEEETILSPLVRRYRKQEGVDLRGPLPSDIMMPLALRGDLDALVYLYHDQGNIALKAVGFGEEVVFYPGLPIAISTVAHGTAYDIAGRGQADPKNFIEAIRQTANLVQRLGQ